MTGPLKWGLEPWREAAPVSRFALPEVPLRISQMAKTMTAIGRASRGRRTSSPPRSLKSPAIRCIYPSSHRSRRASWQRRKAEGSAACWNPARSSQVRPRPSPSTSST